MSEHDGPLTHERAILILTQEREQYRALLRRSQEQVARLAEVLCGLEVNEDTSCAACGWCRCARCLSHAPDCELDAALTAAGYGPEERRRVREGR